MSRLRMRRIPIPKQRPESRFTVITSESMLDSQITDSFSTLENLTLFANAVTANFDGVQNVAIEPKSLSITYNTDAAHRINRICMYYRYYVPNDVSGNFTDRVDDHCGSVDNDRNIRTSWWIFEQKQCLRSLEQRSES